MEPSSSGGLESGSPPSTSSPAEADDLFECCVCLDLIYKPVVRGQNCLWCLEFRISVKDFI
ncbi:unnamed protein product [Spirodela intermedia]|uniref:Uncharacterized protein n=2 Tax=Spirodela intermedia TaxID=51605 RepID=A0A7I8KP63_SPIIN|nr:unnamed protein product [Spirodela intermedia]CAA6663154.1 unnamed protein product [Spirodela intermedia]CAA7399599.1 unnamed protein product [Spirodela intermedia]